MFIQIQSDSNNTHKEKTRNDKRPIDDRTFMHLKCFFRPDLKSDISHTFLKSNGSVFHILAPRYLKDPWYLVVLARGSRSRSLCRVYMPYNAIQNSFYANIVLGVSYADVDERTTYQYLQFEEQ